MTRDEVMAMWLYMNEIWPNYEIPASDARQRARVQVWVDLCGNLAAGLARAAIASLSTRDFPPTPGQIRAEALNLSRQSTGESAAPDVDEAWREFQDRYRSRGPWSHPAVAAAATALGCKEFGASMTADLMAWRAHFFKLYDVTAKRSHREANELPPVLASYFAGAIKRAPQPELDGGNEG